MRIHIERVYNLGPIIILVIATMLMTSVGQNTTNTAPIKDRINIAHKQLDNFTGNMTDIINNIKMQMKMNLHPVNMEINNEGVSS